MRKEIGDKVKPFERPINGDWPYLVSMPPTACAHSHMQRSASGLRISRLRRPWNVRIHLSRSRVRTRDTFMSIAVSLQDW